MHFSTMKLHIVSRVPAPVRRTLLALSVLGISLTISRAAMATRCFAYVSESVELEIESVSFNGAVEPALGQWQGGKGTLTASFSGGATMSSAGIPGTSGSFSGAIPQVDVPDVGNADASR